MKAGKLLFNSIVLKDFLEKVVHIIFFSIAPKALYLVKVVFLFLFKFLKVYIDSRGVFTFYRTNLFKLDITIYKSPEILDTIIQIK